MKCRFCLQSTHSTYDGYCRSCWFFDRPASEPGPVRFERENADGSTRTWFIKFSGNRDAQHQRQQETIDKWDARQARRTYNLKPRWPLGEIVCFAILAAIAAIEIWTMWVTFRGFVP